MSSGLLDDAAAATSPAITAPARDCNASAKCFSSATNTRSSGDAAAMLATPLTIAPPSPTSRAPAAVATSRTDRFIALTVSQQVDQTEVLSTLQGFRHLTCFFFSP